MMRNQRGSSLGVVLVATLLLAALGLSLSAGLHTAYGRLERTLDGDRARYVARAGFEVACLDVLASESSWLNLGPGQAWADVELQPGGTYDITYAGASDAHHVQVHATGRVRETAHSLIFAVERSGFGQPIRITRVEDVSLTRLVQ